MTKDDFVNAATPLIRQGITLTAGLLAAKGMTAAGNSLEVWAVSGSLFGASIIWALAEKSKLLGSIIDAAPASDLDAALSVVQQFRAQGVSPVLVAHMVQVASSLAVAELTAAAPLADPSTVQAPPADVTVPPAAASPGVTTAAASAPLAPPAPVPPSVQAAQDAVFGGPRTSLAPTAASPGVTPVADPTTTAGPFGAQT